MELIKIDDQKLKIMLTPSDMTHYELNMEQIGEGGAQTQQSFRLLMDEVRKQIGFDFDDRRISVQYFPSREGGCEMFVSCMQPRYSGEEKKKLPVARTPGALTLRSGKEPSGGFRKDSAYRFESMEALLCVCQRLHNNGYMGESEAYRDDTNRYYLLLRTRSASPFSTPEELCFIVEYGIVENPAMLRIYFREHGRMICPCRAVERLAELK